MNDIEVQSSGELMVAHIESQTEAATEFIDSYVSETMSVVDSGRIMLPTDDVDTFVEAAKAQGLKVELGEAKF